MKTDKGDPEQRCVVAVAGAQNNVASISTVQLKGELNQVADILRRRLLRESKGSLGRCIFSPKQVEQSISGRLSVPTLAISSVFYAFPPLALLLAVLRKFQSEWTILIMGIGPEDHGFQSFPRWQYNLLGC